ncbi:hypothetical protein CORC01_05991, partial [Colletotrichum orchidophilum]
RVDVTSGWEHGRPIWGHGRHPLVCKLSFTLFASEADAKQAPYCVGCGIFADSGQKEGDRVYCYALDMMASMVSKHAFPVRYRFKLRYSENGAGAMMTMPPANLKSLLGPCLCQPTSLESGLGKFGGL